MATVLEEEAGSTPVMQGDTPPRRVYVLDDEPQVLEIIQIQLATAGFDVVTFNSPEPFLSQLATIPPGVVLVDQRMPPHADGLEVQRRLQERPNCFKVIMLSGYPETRIAVQAMKQGAITVLDKPYNKDELLRVLAIAFAELERTMTESAGLPDALPSGQLYLEFLSPRERAVIDLVYQGETNKSVGITLGISIKTVEKHRGKAMKKMHVNSLAELIRLIDRELPQIDMDT